CFQRNRFSAASCDRDRRPSDTNTRASTSNRTAVRHTIDGNECFRMPRHATARRPLRCAPPVKIAANFSSDGVFADHTRPHRLRGGLQHRRRVAVQVGRGPDENLGVRTNRTNTLSVERHMGNLFADVRYAVRLLIKKPGFAAVAILTMALGVGATTAIFTVVHAVLLRPLPFRDADRLVQVRITGRNNGIFPLPDTDFLAWRSQNQIADAVAVSANERQTITGDGMAEQVSGCAVTDRFFDVLGTRPLFGRVFQPGDDKPDAPKSVVLSHALWSRRYHADPAIVGRVIL